MIDLELQDEIKNETAKDDFFVKALQAVKENGPLPIRSSLEEWKIEEEILFFKDRCYIPPYEELQREVVKWYYDSLSGKHPGQFKTLELIWRYYWWPGMTVFIKNYIAGCTICQQMKINTHPSSSSLIPIKGQKDTKLFSQVTCDFITDLLKNDRFDSLMVVVDYGSTKVGNFYPLQQNNWCHTHSTKLHWPHVPMLRTLRLLPIWPWPTILLTSLQRNGLTPRNQKAQKHGVSPSD